MSATQPSKRNNYISYIRGFAILFVILIHLVDWSGVKVNGLFKYIFELFYTGVIFFVALVGSVVYEAYSHRGSLKEVTYKLVRNGLQIILIYFFFNIVKFYIYDFGAETYYLKYIEKGTFDIWGILTLQSISFPISIFITLGTLMLISPFFVWIVRTFKNYKVILYILLFGLIYLNYFVEIPNYPIWNFLLARNNTTFPILLWTIPYLIGIIVASYGFEKKLIEKLAVSLLVGILMYFLVLDANFVWDLSKYMYPLSMIYVAIGFGFMQILIYLIKLIEKIQNNFVGQMLTILKHWGDNSLNLYLGHWIVIDIIYLLVEKNYWTIWIGVTVFVIFFTIFLQNRAKIEQFCQNLYRNTKKINVKI